jgi:taurine dioxygenase
MEIKLLSGALGAEIKGIDLTDVSDENFKKVNDLLLEHKVIFFRDQPITKEQQIALAEKFGPLETHAYVKGLDNYPEIVRIIKGKEEKNQWGENWHSDVSYNSKPTKAVILKINKNTSSWWGYLFFKYGISVGNTRSKNSRKDQR